MLISPSVASSDLFHLEEETSFADKYFHQIHIDVEDGTMVSNITMGMPVCRTICEKWNSSYRSVHLSVLDPMKSWTLRKFSFTTAFWIKKMSN